MNGSESDQAVADALRDVLLDLGRAGTKGVTRLAQFYDEAVVFRDPVQTLQGRGAFLEMNRRLIARARHFSLDVTEAVGKNGTIFLVWTMVYERRALPRVTVEGMTRARLRGGLVVEQRDYWDLLSTAAASIPLVGWVYAALARHLA